MPFLIVSTLGFSQNIEDISSTDYKQKAKDKFRAYKNLKPIQASGSIGFNTRAYTAFGSVNRQTPFSYGLNANLNIAIYEKINMPFSFMYYENGIDGSHPFTREFWDLEAKLDAFKNSTQ